MATSICNGKTGLDYVISCVDVIIRAVSGYYGEDTSHYVYRSLVNGRSSFSPHVSLLPSEELSIIMDKALALLVIYAVSLKQLIPIVTKSLCFDAR